MSLDRRALVAGGVGMLGALAGCSRGEGAATARPPAGEDPLYPTAAGRADGPSPSPAPAPAPPAEPSATGLRAIAPFPIGAQVTAEQLDDPALAALAAREASQITAGLEMKMEVVLKDDGRLDFAPGDRVAAFARANRQRLHGHTLIWYSQEPKPFLALDGRPGFAAAHDRYIGDVVGHWREAVSWDVVNEPIAEFGEGLRPCLWSRNLGPETYIDRALHVAHAAAPAATLFVNEYFLEKLPAKRRAFMALAERLMKRGAPIGGLGCQSHLDLALAPGAAKAAIADLASLGLPIHISELDVSLTGRRVDGGSREQALQDQARLYGEVMEAFMALPARQRFAFTLWSLRDRDSWLRTQPGNAGDAPCVFDDAGRPKPAYAALEGALRARG